MLHLVKTEPDFRPPVVRGTVPPELPEPVTPKEIGTDLLLALYYELRDQATQEMAAGRAYEALGLCGEALYFAEQTGDEPLIDQAYCNRVGIALTLGETGELKESMVRLREIVMRNRSVGTAFSAAYNLSLAHEIGKDFKKALFYARIARDKALAAQDEDWLAKSYHQLGCCLLSDSYYSNAVQEFKNALERLPQELCSLHTAVLCNMGEAKVLLGELADGFKCLFKALRWYIQHPDEKVYRARVHLVLCFAYLEKGRLCHAWKHGRKSLEMADDLGLRETTKHALYLLGQVEKTAGDYESAWQYYARIQQEFHPDIADLPDVMLVYDTKELVNLRA